jgi:hypothetical protein
VVSMYFVYQNQPNPSKNCGSYYIHGFGNI